MLTISETKTKWLKERIRDIPDFPKPGILFRDITTLLADGEAFAYVVDALSEEVKKLNAEKIAGIEARGFILGAAVAYKLGLGFIPIRKPGKLPHIVEALHYDLEYGKDSLEIHADAVKAKERIVVIDDLLATGGSAAAACQLLEKLGAHISGVGVVIHLQDLGGKVRLPKDAHFFTLVEY